MREQDWGLDPYNVGGGGGNISYGEGWLDESWVISNGFTGGIAKDEGVHY